MSHVHENEMALKVRHDHASFQALLQDTCRSKQVKSHAHSLEDDKDVADIHAFKHAL